MEALEQMVAAGGKFRLYGFPTTDAPNIVMVRHLGKLCLQAEDLWEQILKEMFPHSMICGFSPSFPLKRVCDLMFAASPEPLPTPILPVEECIEAITEAGCGSPLDCPPGLSQPFRQISSLHICKLVDSTESALRKIQVTFRNLRTCIAIKRNDLHPESVFEKLLLDCLIWYAMEMCWRSTVPRNIMLEPPREVDPELVDAFLAVANQADAICKKISYC